MRNRTASVLGVWVLVLVAYLSASMARGQTPAAEAELARSTAAYEKGDLPAALQHAQKAVDLAPEAAETHLEVGTIADSMCIPNAQPGPDMRVCNLAILEYEKAIQIEPSYPGGFKSLAFLLYQFYRLDESEGYYRKALARGPTDPEVLGSLAAIVAMRSWSEVVMAKFQEKIPVHQPLIEPSRCSGIRDRNVGRVEEAIALSTEALRIESRRIDLMGWLSSLYAIRAELQCGDRKAYRSDKKVEKRWNRTRMEAWKGGTDDRSPFKIPPPPPPIK